MTAPTARPGTGSGNVTGGPGTAGANGGGIFNAGSLAILDSTISDSRAGDGGDGGSAQGGGGAFAPTGGDGFQGIGGRGGDGGDGGGIYNTGALAMTRVAVTGNTAGQGGTGAIGTGGQGGARDRQQQWQRRRGYGR